MKSIRYAMCCIAALSLLATTAFAQGVSSYEFKNGYPVGETVTKLFDEMDFQRATQAYLWAVPIVSFEAFRQGVERDLGVTYNDFSIWDNFCDPKSLVLTANNTTIYAMSEIDLGRDGLVVLDVPAGAVVGMVDDFWQRSATDLGLTGPDRGKGGKYLMVPPDYKGELPQSGYFVVQATMNNNSFMIRGLVQNGDVAKAVATLKKCRVYPYSQRNNPRPNEFTSASGKHLNTLNPTDMRYWELLSSVINNNPVHERDRFFMAMLKPLGIEKGKPFQPNERQKRILKRGLDVGGAMARNMLYQGELRFERANKWKGTHWSWAVILSPDQESENYSQLDERLHWFYGASYMTPAMARRQAGPGSMYLQSFQDSKDEWLDGSNTYRLHIPPNPPVTQFWSLTVYDNVTRSMLQNPANDVSLSSYDKLRINDDGSVDVYIGPKPPEGYESNWIQSVPGKGWYPFFRAYGPTEAFFDDSWSLKDFEKIK